MIKYCGWAMTQGWDLSSSGKKRRTHQTFPMARRPRPKWLMKDEKFHRFIYKAHQTNVWWTMKVFRLHCMSSVREICQSSRHAWLLPCNFTMDYIASSDKCVTFHCHISHTEYTVWDLENSGNGFLDLVMWIVWHLARWKFICESRCHFSKVWALEVL